MHGPMTAYGKYHAPGCTCLRITWLRIVPVGNRYLCQRHCGKCKKSMFFAVFPLRWDRVSSSHVGLFSYKSEKTNSLGKCRVPTNSVISSQNGVLEKNTYYMVLFYSTIQTLSLQNFTSHFRPRLVISLVLRSCYWVEWRRLLGNKYTYFKYPK